MAAPPMGGATWRDATWRDAVNLPLQPGTATIQADTVEDAATREPKRWTDRRAEVSRALRGIARDRIYHKNLNVPRGCRPTP